MKIREARLTEKGCALLALHESGFLILGSFADDTVFVDADEQLNVLF